MRKLNGLTATGAVAVAVLLTGVTPALAGTEPGTGSGRVGTVSPLIVGGRPASESYPAMVSLQTRVGDDPDWHFCGGSLVTPWAVLTNAHCVTLDDAGPVPAGLIHVRVGSHDRSSGGDVAGVREIVVHPAWDWATGDGPVADVAVLKLDRAVSAQPLSIGGYPQWSAATRLLGWGLTTPDGSTLPTGLHELDTQLVDRERCASAGISVGELCVGNPRPGAGACYGDSGGPAMQRGPAGRWQLVGGASRETHPVCGAGSGSIFTDLTYFRQWIGSVVFTGTPLPGANLPGRTVHRKAGTAGRSSGWTNTWPGARTA